jgi:hypothetical protein
MQLAQGKLVVSLIGLLLVSCCKRGVGYTLSVVRVRVTLQLTVSQSVCLGVEPILGLLTRDSFFFDSYSLVLFDERSDLSFVSLCQYSLHSQYLHKIFTYCVTHI